VLDKRCERWGSSGGEKRGRCGEEEERGNGGQEDEVISGGNDVIYRNHSGASSLVFCT